MNPSPSPQRRHPAHPPPVVRLDHSTVIYVTMCVNKRRPLLANPTTHQLLLRSWRQSDTWQIGRYTIMPDHLHFFCAPSDPQIALGHWMNFWRNAFTRAWPNRSEKPIWQKGYWDTQLRQGESYSVKWDYVRNNPVRRGLATHAEDWPYQGELEMLEWHGP